MHSSSLASSSSSHRSTASGSTLPGSSYSPAPGTPQLGYVPLPPSPLSPYGAASNMHAPRAPRMGTVSLPPSEPSTPSHGYYGLATPPQSPPDIRRLNSLASTIHPLLAYSPQPSIYFNVSVHPSQAPLRSPYTQASVQEGAFQTPTNSMVVRVAEFDLSFNIVASRGVITVADVLQSIFNWANKPCSRELCQRFPPAVFNMASQYFSARGGAARGGDSLRMSDFLCGRLRFMGLTRTAGDSNCWDLHLANLS